ncbi:unnamed protein product [Lepeophtheirus salmonis]|uniref:(salmon louse) hypothetical protein n=1 Tax=Lepeophtheirus salmonis TaxID=72036 RepID=A0A7R8GYN1_LEPSM|nr:unnamed protein product [Lepeophtheirus salmonis]CAF2750746.1 unnamed protein product [Lepeophtheirus salmonis]
MMARFSDECNKLFLWSPNSFEPINPSPYTSNLNDPHTSLSQSASKTTQNTSELNEFQASLSQSAPKTSNEKHLSHFHHFSSQKKNTNLDRQSSKHWNIPFMKNLITLLHVLAVLGKLLTGKWMKKFYNSYDSQLNYLDAIQTVKEVVERLKRVY